MKLLLIALSLFSSMAYSNRPHRCLQAAKNYAFETYKSECGGYGEIEDCNDQATTKVINQKLKTTIFCGYSGEPDYNDSLEMEILVDASSCRILNTQVNECYTN